MSQYPFPAYNFKTEEGNFGIRSEAEMVLFSNIDEVQKWVNAMIELQGIFSHEYLGLSGSIFHVIEQYSENKFTKENNKFYKEDVALQRALDRKFVPGLGHYLTRDGLEPIFVYNDFFEKIAESMIIVKNTQKYLNRADRLKSDYPAKIKLGAIFLLNFLAICLGIIYPVTAKVIKQIFVLWIPFAIYVIIFVFIYGTFF